MNLLLLALTAMAAMLVSCASSRIPEERHVALRTRANFKKQSTGADDANYTLQIGSEGGVRSVCWPGEAPLPGTLARHRIYTVELLEEECWIRMGDEVASFWSPELFRLSDGDRLLYDASVCRRHGIRMERMVVPISYGFPMFSRDDSRAREAEFPNTGMVLGGCCVNEARPLTHAWVCPTCLANKSRWENQQGKKKTKGEP